MPTHHHPACAVTTLNLLKSKAICILKMFRKLILTVIHLFLFIQQSPTFDDLFSKYPCYVHKECLETKKWEQYWVKSSKTSQELGNCPMGQRDALWKERLYRNKIEKFYQNFEIWSKFWNLVKILKFDQNFNSLSHPTRVF